MIFPNIIGRPGYVNLGQYGPAWLAKNGYRDAPENPLLDPAICDRMVRDMHAELGVAYSYGGWLEDRTALWRGSYLDAMAPNIHLGVDFNVPAGTIVACDTGGHVLRVDNDCPEMHGWGTRIFIRLIDAAGIVLVYAHLKLAFYKAGESIKPGEGFAFTGGPEENGGWFPHLHVQALSAEAYRCFAQAPEHRKPELLDGYGHAMDREELAKLYPDPLSFLRLG